jgi:hypothetical protein
MAELELKRVPHDRRLYELNGVGTVRLEGLLARAATGEADGLRWRFSRRGFWGRTVEATDVKGATVGEFSPSGLRRGGELHWGERGLALRPSSAWRERYALVEGDRELAVLDGKGWGSRPVAVGIEDPTMVEAGLLLFAAFVVRGLAEDANAAAGAGASAAVSGG